MGGAACVAKAGSSGANPKLTRSETIVARSSREGEARRSRLPGATDEHATKPSRERRRESGTLRVSFGLGCRRACVPCPVWSPSCSSPPCSKSRSAGRQDRRPPPCAARHRGRGPGEGRAIPAALPPAGTAPAPGRRDQGEPRSRCGTCQAQDPAGQGTPSSPTTRARRSCWSTMSRASAGNTPQYATLEALQKKYEAKGFTVVGFPCNQFGGQEPGTSEEIATFCATNYGITFPIMEKLEVNGPGRSPIYQALTPIADVTAARPATSAGTSRSSSCRPTAPRSRGSIRRRPIAGRPGP